MHDTVLEDIIVKEIEPVVSGLGFSIVELKVGYSTNLVSISLVIHSPGGVTVNDCAKVSQTIHPILDLIENCGNFTLKVMSPGVGRVVKNIREYGIFINRRMRFLLTEKKDWITGTIKKAEDDGIWADVDGGSQKIPYTNIKKAILD